MTQHAPVWRPIAADHPAFAGHFPGQPLLPGVSILAEVIEAAMADPAWAAAIGPCPSIASAKFLAPVRPGSVLAVQFGAAARGLRFEVRVADALVASGQFEAAPR